MVLSEEYREIFIRADLPLFDSVILTKIILTRNNNIRSSNGPVTFHIPQK